jgi:hypothetical protein
VGSVFLFGDMMKKNTIDSLRGRIVYSHSNGMCYSGELDIESFKNSMRYVIKRAIPIHSSSINNLTIYIDPNRVEKIDGSNIYLKQEEKGN